MLTDYIGDKPELELGSPRAGCTNLAFLMKSKATANSIDGGRVCRRSQFAKKTWRFANSPVAGRSVLVRGYVSARREFAGTGVWRGPHNTDHENAAGWLAPMDRMGTPT